MNGASPAVPETSKCQTCVYYGLQCIAIKGKEKHKDVKCVSSTVVAGEPSLHTCWGWGGIQDECLALHLVLLLNGYTCMWLIVSCTIIIPQLS